MRRRESPHERRVNRLLRDLREAEYQAAVRRQREREERDRRTYPVFVAILVLYAVGMLVWILW